MSRAYNKRKKMIRRTLFEMLPQLRHLHNLIRHKGFSPWRAALDPKGNPLMFQGKRLTFKHTGKRATGIVGVRSEEKLKALYELGKQRATHAPAVS